jgi:hypothetical protein
MATRKVTHPRTKSIGPTEYLEKVEEVPPETHRQKSTEVLEPVEFLTTMENIRQRDRFGVFFMIMMTIVILATLSLIFLNAFGLTHLAESTIKWLLATVIGEVVTLFGIAAKFYFRTR